MVQIPSRAPLRSTADRLASLFINGRGDNRRTGVTWGQWLGDPACPYLRRWVLNVAHVGSLRVHHWHGSDDPRYLHDHGWWFVTLVLKGGYADVQQASSIMDVLRPGSVRFRAATHTHSVQVAPGGCWTIMLTGPVSRDWGFWVDGTWMRMRRFFREYGHHPCD